MCGVNGGRATCPLNTCCSSSGYCGVTAPYCGSGCQAAYGSCKIPIAPSCAAGSKSATNGRRVGYWQVDQAYGRSCDAVLPSQIKTAGMTHLVLAFALIDAKTYKVKPASPEDVPFYTQFTALQSDSLQTWISIGGGDFSTKIWSSMAVTQRSRAAFISSLKSFLLKYSFEGVDIDWEFPSLSDARNLVSLLSELRAALGSDIGISSTLPADFGSLVGFNVPALAKYVDFFNYMAYDVHGWGVDSGAAQRIVRYPADIRDISTYFLPIWASGIDPNLINLGVPLYGRGYTVNQSCQKVGCRAIGPSKSGSCFKDSTGVMVLTDIKQAVSANKATTVLDRNSMQKYATWGNQWMGYDDAATLALKLGWADKVCLGGAIFWAIDFDGGKMGT
ncbi:glycoside hydrolase [Thozetella sp. PMI_491]|nr:glycoside hydrolase [Thozetella sp. PMI_491]